MSDHQDSPMHALYQFSTGDMVALLDLIPCDERDSLVIPGEGSVTFARCGRVHIMASTDAATFSAHAHPTVEAAEKCYAGALEHFGSVARSDDPRAEAQRVMERMEDSMPPELREAAQRAMARGDVRRGLPQDMPPAVRAALEALRDAVGPGVEIITHTVNVSDEDMRGGYL